MKELLLVASIPWIVYFLIGLWKDSLTKKKTDKEWVYKFWLEIFMFLSIVILFIIGVSFYENSIYGNVSDGGKGILTAFILVGSVFVSIIYTGILTISTFFHWKLNYTRVFGVLTSLCVLYYWFQNL